VSGTPNFVGYTLKSRYEANMTCPAKILPHGDDIFVEIPDALLAAKGWHIGDTLSVSLTDGGVHLERVDDAGVDEGDKPNF
jgi:hypothetical protein